MPRVCPEEGGGGNVDVSILLADKTQKIKIYFMTLYHNTKEHTQYTVSLCQSYKAFKSRLSLIPD